MRRRPPRSTRTDTLFPLHDALPILSKTDSANAIMVCSTACVALGGLVTAFWGWSIPDLRGLLLLMVTGMLQGVAQRSEEHTSELHSLMRISYAVFCLNKKKHTTHRPS